MSRTVSFIILYNKINEIFLQQRELLIKRHPCKWGFFGGGITINETQTQGVLRECFEELGYNLKNPKLIISETISNGNHINIFKEEFDETKQIILEKGRGYGWVTIVQSNNLDIIPENLELLNKIKYLIFTN